MNRSSWLLTLAVTLALTGCPDRAVFGFPDVPDDAAQRDAEGDSGMRDAGPDAEVDALAMLDTGLDAPVDVGSDVGMDGGSDAGFDVGFDVGTDGGRDAPMLSDAGRRGPAPVLLGLPGDLTQSGAYALIGKTGITNVTGSLITGGHLGVSPGAASLITGFALVLDATNQFATSPSVMAPFRIYAADYASPTPANLTSAVLSMQTAYTDAAGRPTPDFLNLMSGNLGGLTLAPGLYSWGSSVTIPSTVTLSGGPNDTWIFQVTGDLELGTATNVILTGGADARNVFWQVAGRVTIRANAHFEGNILCQTGITMQTGASLRGRALAQTLVALDNNAITMP